MARAGSQKVKTGCQTCKARKVKCDETRPKCKRCTTSGRTCDGYRALPAGSFSWDVLLRTTRPRLIPVTNSHEIRSLSYFHYAVGPILSGPFDSSFWTYFIPQMTHSEPAVRHAVLAISSLYEGFNPARADEPQIDRFAVSHYDRAINLLVNDPEPNINNVLVVCVLFVCIELLRGNREAAISHASHGIQLLNTAGQNLTLATIFSQMSIFPLFFVEEGAEFPLLRNTGTDERNPIFFSTSEARLALDELCMRILRLIRAGNPYRFDKVQRDPPQDMYERQSRAMSDLDAWDKAFASFQTTQLIADGPDTTMLALKVRQRLTKVWLANCFKRGEIGYDENRDDFTEVLGWAQAAADKLEATKMSPAKFTFDTGFNPMLHFIVHRCRNLRIRLDALGLMRRLSSQRESLWDASLMYDMSRRIIEVEHNIDLDGNCDLDYEAVPSDSKRVMGYFFQESKEAPPQDLPKSLPGEPVYFVVWNEEGSVAFRRDFLKRNTSNTHYQVIAAHSIQFPRLEKTVKAVD